MEISCLGTLFFTTLDENTKQVMRPHEDSLGLVRLRAVKVAMLHGVGSADFHLCWCEFHFIPLSFKFNKLHRFLVRKPAPGDEENKRLLLFSCEHGYLQMFCGDAATSFCHLAMACR